MAKMKIIIEDIPHSEQRIKGQVGDYFYDEDGTLRIKVSNVGSQNFNFLIAIHELVEAKLCEVNGVSYKDIDEFDTGWIEHSGYTEAGLDINAPYRDEHAVADVFERLMAVEIKENWNEYETSLNAIGDL